MPGCFVVVTFKLIRNRSPAKETVSTKRHVMRDWHPLFSFVAITSSPRALFVNFRIGEGTCTLQRVPSSILSDQGTSAIPDQADRISIVDQAIVA